MFKKGDWVEIELKKEPKNYFYHGTFEKETDSTITINDIKLGEITFNKSNIILIRKMTKFEIKLRMITFQSIRKLEEFDIKIRNLNDKIMKDAHEDFEKISIKKRRN